MNPYRLICPFCKAQMLLTYGNFGWYYRCETLGCDCTHSCHQKSKKPMGCPADRTTREARHKAHVAFDKIWTEASMTRKNAYIWLAKEMETKGECHIGSLTEQQCKKVIEISEKKLTSLEVSD